MATSLVLVCFEAVFSSLRSSWGRFGSPQLIFRASKTMFLALSTHSTHALDSLSRSTHSTSAQDVILSNPSGRRTGKPESKRAREQESKRAREHESKRAKIQGRRGSAGAPKGLQLQRGPRPAHEARRRSARQWQKKPAKTKRRQRRHGHGNPGTRGTIALFSPRAPPPRRKPH